LGLLGVHLSGGLLQHIVNNNFTIEHTLIPQASTKKVKEKALLSEEEIFGTN
jgi:hypothetical protein